MPWQWSPSVIAELVAASILLLLAVYFPWRDLNRRARFNGVTLTLGCALWMLSHAFEIGLPVVSYKEPLVGVQLVLGTISVTFWLFFILNYLGPKGLLTRRFRSLFGIVLLVAVLALSTNGVHGLMWTASGIDVQNPYLPLQPTYGIVYWACMIYVAMLTLAGSSLIVWSIIRRRNSFTRESISLLVAAVLPLATALVEVTGLLSSSRISVGPTPWAACIGAVILISNLPRFHLEQVIPVARDITFDRIGDCILVLDMQDRVLDLNPAAERLIGCTMSEALGLSIEQVWPFHATPKVPLNEMVKTGEELVVERDGRQRTYHPSVSPINDAGGRPMGQVFLLTDITERKKAEEQLLVGRAELERQLRGTVHVIQEMTEARDAYTSGHQRRVAELAVAIARQMGLPEDSCVPLIDMAARIHDIGKVVVPAEILSKPGRLSPAEFALIKTHPQAGYDILKQAELPYPVPETVLQHHERYDGSGYPAGLSGDDILPEASILAVADVVEAMSSHRPYRAALGIEPALTEIAEGSGTRYYPDVVTACIAVFRENGFTFSN